MLDSKRTPNSSSHCPSERRVSRRGFLRDVTVLSATALGGSILLGACSPAPATPTAPSAPTDLMGAPPTLAPIPAPPEQSTAGPPPAGVDTLMEAFQNRRSASGFAVQALPAPALLELLWAAWGINRPESGKRTAPSAMNSQEIDIYVLLADGVYVYDAQANQLTRVLEQDLRSKAARGSLGDAAVQLVFVADHAKLRGGSQTEKDQWSAAHSGFIGQNVYLYCASKRLAARFYASIDRAALKASLNLREQQSIVFAQAVGYPKG